MTGTRDHRSTSPRGISWPTVLVAVVVSSAIAFVVPEMLRDTEWARERRIEQTKRDFESALPTWEDVQRQVGDVTDKLVERIAERWKGRAGRHEFEELVFEELRRRGHEDKVDTLNERSLRALTIRYVRDVTAFEHPDLPPLGPGEMAEVLIETWSEGK